MNVSDDSSDENFFGGGVGGAASGLAGDDSAGRTRASMNGLDDSSDGEFFLGGAGGGASGLAHGASSFFEESSDDNVGRGPLRRSARQRKRLELVIVFAAQRDGNGPRLRGASEPRRGAAAL